MTVAETMEPLLHAALGRDVAIRITCWDGSAIGPASAPLHLVVRTRRALRRVVWAPNELGFARAYVSGDLEVEGDLVSGLEELDRLADPARGPGVDDRRGHQEGGRQGGAAVAAWWGCRPHRRRRRRSSRASAQRRPRRFGDLRTTTTSVTTSTVWYSVSR